MPNETIELNESQMTTLATSIADIMMKRQDDLSKDAAEKAAAEKAAAEKAAIDKAAADAEAAATEDKPKSQSAPAFDMQELITGVTAAIKGTQEADANKVYETLFNDKLTQVTGSVPGLQEYLEGKDDYDRVRMDVLTSESDYQSRIDVLNKITDTFRKATANNGGQTPTVSKKAKETAVANEAKYEELDKKWAEGEYDNVADYTNDFFQMLSSEVSDLQAA